MFLYIVIFLIFFIISLEHPDFMFWLAATIFFDPGGYILFNFSRSILGGIQLTDLTFVLLFIPLLSPKVNISNYFRFKDNRWIFNFLLFFAVVYHVLIFGYISPAGSISTLLDTLQYQRLTIWGFLVVVPAYIFFRRNYMLLVNFAFITSVLLSAIYLLYLFTGLPIIPIWTHERGLGIEATRIAMKNYGFAYWFIYISITIVLFKFRFPRKKWIYFVGLTLFIAVILTLTRRSILLLLYAPIIIYFLHQSFLNRSILSGRLSKLLLPFSIAVLLLFTIAPDYVNYSISMVNNVIGIAKFQTVDERFERDIPVHLSRFNKAPVIGYGYDKLWYSNKAEEGGLSANDVPLTAALGMFGIVGLVLFSIFYLKIIKILFNSFKILRSTFQKKIAQKNVILFTINFIILISFIAFFTLNFLGLFGDLITGQTRIKMMINLGILLASRDMLYIELTKFQNKSVITKQKYA